MGNIFVSFTTVSGNETCEKLVKRPNKKEGEGKFEVLAMRKGGKRRWKTKVEKVSTGINTWVLQQYICYVCLRARSR